MSKVVNFWKNHLHPLAQNLFFNTIGQLCIRFFGSVDNRNLKYEVSMCLIFKDEGRFLKEWMSAGKKETT